jgi:hypothetical protein
MSKAGSSLLRATFVRAADTARKQDPQLARIYYVRMVERGKDHLKAVRRGGQPRRATVKEGCGEGPRQSLQDIRSSASRCIPRGGS